MKVAFGIWTVVVLGVASLLCYNASNDEYLRDQWGSKTLSSGWVVESTNPVNMEAESSNFFLLRGGAELISAEVIGIEHYYVKTELEGRWTIEDGSTIDFVFSGDNMSVHIYPQTSVVVGNIFITILLGLLIWVVGLALGVAISD